MTFISDVAFLFFFTLPLLSCIFLMALFYLFPECCLCALLFCVCVCVCFVMPHGDDACGGGGGDGGGGGGCGVVSLRVFVSLLRFMCVALVSKQR